MLTILLALVAVADPFACPQLPPAAQCRDNAWQLTRILRDMETARDWERLPLHPALDAGTRRNIDAWYLAAEIQNVTLPCHRRAAAQEKLRIEIGEAAFRNGWMPPVPVWTFKE